MKSWKAIQKTDRKFAGLSYKAHSKQRKQKANDELQGKQKDMQERKSNKLITKLSLNSSDEQ